MAKSTPKLKPRTTKTAVCPECGQVCNLMGLANHIRLKHRLKITTKVVEEKHDPITPRSAPLPQTTSSEVLREEPSTPLPTLKSVAAKNADAIRTAPARAVEEETVSPESLLVYTNDYGTAIACPVCGANYFIHVGYRDEDAPRLRDFESHLMYKHNRSPERALAWRKAVHTRMYIIRRTWVNEGVRR